MFFTELHLSNIVFICCLALFASFALIYFYRNHYKNNKFTFLENPENFLQLGLLFFSLVFLLFSLLGPRYISQDSNTLGTHIVFVLDVSHSMNVRDVQYLNSQVSRLEAAKNIISKYASENPHNTYALSIFSGDVQKVLPFSHVSNTFLTIMNAVNNKNVGGSGTDISEALQTSIEFFHTEKSGGLMILFTDGGDEEIQVSQALKDELKQKYIDIAIVGLGSRQGGYIPLGVDVFGNTKYAIYEGRRATSKLNTASLENLAYTLDVPFFEFLDMSLYTSFESEVQKLGKKVNILQSGVSKSLQYYCIVIAGILFFIVFLSKLFSFPILGRKK